MQDWCAYNLDQKEALKKFGKWLHENRADFRDIQKQLFYSKGYVMDLE